MIQPPPSTKRSDSLVSYTMLFRSGWVCYSGGAELEIPLGSGAKEMGLRPSVFVDAGAVFGLKNPVPTPSNGVCTNNTTGTRVGTVGKGKCPTGATLVLPPFEEDYVGDTPSPRVSVGFGEIGRAHV